MLKFTNSRDSDTPAAPDSPVNPDTPEKPDVPDNPDEPSNPSMPDNPTPKTGDESNVGLWLALMISSFAAFTGVCIYGRKRRYTGHHVQK